jgi:hydroxymethylpyrimidine pyrophosphatase-like HAD family hydrolase
MKPKLLALDYDGTMAQAGVLHPSVQTAIVEARAHDIAAVIVTGRILDDLKRVAGDLRFLVGVVAENGAVLAFPASGCVKRLGAAPPPTFLSELERRGVEARQGDVIVEADSERAPDILAVIRDLELPLTLTFNRDRVMVLPPTIDKASGLRALLRILGHAEQDAVGIGDAENDHALLAACGVGVAVAWGDDALKAQADEILDGDGPAAVASFIRRLIQT